MNEYKFYEHRDGSLFNVKADTRLKAKQKLIDHMLSNKFYEPLEDEEFSVETFEQYFTIINKEDIFNI